MSLLPRSPGAAREGNFPADRFTQSALFDGSSGRLAKTWSGMQVQDSRKWTFSCHLKLGNPNAGDSHILYRVIDSNGYCSVFQSNGAFALLHRDNSTNYTRFYTPYSFLDASAWYHLVVIADTANASAADRIRMYVNGVRVQPDSYTAPAQNASLPLGQNGDYTIGHSPTWGQWWTGYLAELQFIPQQALGPENFGHFDARTGNWVPDNVGRKDGSGRGFHLPSPVASAEGWTKAGTITASKDTASNNYAVINRVGLAISSAMVSKGNLQGNAGSSSYATFKSTLPLTGRKYWEVKWLAQSSFYGGICPAQSDVQNSWPIGYWISHSGKAGAKGTETGIGQAPASGNIMGFAFDADALTLKYYINGSLVNTQTGIAADTYVAATGDFGNQDDAAHLFNFGATAFAHTPPADYLPLCTANLPNAAYSSNAYMAEGKITTAGAAVKVTGVGFKPDLLIWKDAGNSSSMHWIFTPGKALFTNNTLAEAAFANGISSFDPDGFTLGDNVNYTGSGKTFWFLALRKGPHLDITEYTGNGAADQDIGHALGTAPDLVIVKPLDHAGSWYSWTNNIGMSLAAGNYLALDLPNGMFADGAALHGGHAPGTSSVRVKGALNQSGKKYVALFLRNVPGLFHVRKRDAAGTAQFVHAGGQPLVEIIKSTTYAQDWLLFPDSHNPTGPRKNKISVNGTAAFAVTAGTSHHAHATGLFIPGTDVGLINANNAHDYLDLVFLRGCAGGRNVPPAPAGGISKSSTLVLSNL